ncbi:GGDEF domain-containing protein [Bacillus gobiensis]|uniref:GGDEF domain-containing protein n=1 Tax=Bacillus gobiensis TaxID=1441095 RepID=UPI003D20D924
MVFALRQVDVQTFYVQRAHTSFASAIFRYQAFGIQDQLGVQHSYFHIDIDNFKKWNDLYSMSFGNYLLIEIGKRLKQMIVKGKDTVARNESDEFVILSTRLTADGAAAFAEEIAEQLKTGFCINNTKCDLTASIGVAFSDAKTPKQFDQLTRLGETAMQSAKESKVSVFLYIPELDGVR